ncbi:MAG TPA: DEAD/DEAH box helicase [Nannocystaceae bacterium]|nr:DEAD/DEAH box helicase [Nannocystaceae bacterium]
MARLGWTSLRPVQELAGEALLGGQNAVVLAPTAGGKTEASIFPTLSTLLTSGSEGVGAIYVAPIKALLNNQAERLGLYTEMVGLRRFVWHGDTTSHERRSFLKDPADLLMTTPESLEVMLVSEKIDAGALFRDLQVVIIDEVHALAGTDRGAHLCSVIERLARLSRHDVQRVGLSATVGNPEAILGWLQGTSRRAATIVDPPKQPARRQLLVTFRPELSDLARDAAKVAKGGKSLFFCQSRSVTEAVAEGLRRAGTEVFVHHSAVSLEERTLAEERFHHGTDACIVCTSTLELGIDVGDLDRVLQHEAPDSVSSFLQRMGRTGRRAGQVANTSFFCESAEGVVQAIALIELARAGWVERVELSARCWPVLVHQLLAMSLASGGVTPEEAWAHFEVVPDFKGIHRAEYDRLIAWMLRDQSMVLLDGRLLIGPKAERRFGRRNFMELYAVFSSPQSYNVETTAGQPLGTLTQGFVDRLVEGVSCFLLGGRAWSVLRIVHDDRRLVVEAAPRGKKPTWGGFIPNFLGFELCQRILQVVTGAERPAYLDDAAAEVLAGERAKMEGITAGPRGGIMVEAGEIRWWTFAGGRINSTLRYAIEALGTERKIVPDNFGVTIRGEDVTAHGFGELLERLEDPEIWEDEKLWRDVAATLPSYRLSKFQPLMPPWVEREVVASYLLDVAGAWRWLSRAPAATPAARVSPTVAEPTRQEIERLEQPREAPAGPSIRRDEGRPVRWIRSDGELAAACEELRGEPVLGLDVETTIQGRTLCLVQVASQAATYLMDALEIADLGPLAELCRDGRIVKVIHNATFERGVLGRYGVTIEGVVDTLRVSRRLRGTKIEGGHSLKSVCARELGVALDKSEQVSDWSLRPLSPRQVAYAALDAEVLLALYERFGRPKAGDGENLALWGGG